MKAFCSLGCFGIMEILKLERIVLESVCLLFQMDSTSSLPCALCPVLWEVALYRTQQCIPCPLASSQLASAPVGHQHGREGGR